MSRFALYCADVVSGGTSEIKWNQLSSINLNTFKNIAATESNCFIISVLLIVTLETRNGFRCSKSADDSNTWEFIQN